MDSSDHDNGLICLKCNRKLEEHQVFFNYLGHRFNTMLPCCPQCSQIYLSVDLVKSKVKEVEMTLEDK